MYEIVKELFSLLQNYFLSYRTIFSHTVLFSLLQNYFLFHRKLLDTIFFFSLQQQIFEGLEDEDFSFGNESFMPKKNIKKLVLKKSATDSNSPSRASSVINDVPNAHSLNETDNSFLHTDNMYV